MASKYQRLAGKHVLVIGGTAGIGFCVAEASASAGANVTVSSSRESSVRSAISSLEKNYPSSKVRGYVCDLSKSTLEQDLEQLFEQVGEVNHIVITAGDRVEILPLQEITLEKFQKAGHVRFLAPMLIAKVGSRYLSAGPDSSIVLTTGLSSEIPIPNWSIISSYAAGLHGMTKALALDLAPIRVNLVNPGAVVTDLWDKIGLTKDEIQESFKNMKVTNLTRDIAQPEDIAEAYLWLMKDRNVTGTVANSDSGAKLV